MHYCLLHRPRSLRNAGRSQINQSDLFDYDPVGSMVEYFGKLWAKGVYIPNVVTGHIQARIGGGGSMWVAGPCQRAPS